MKIAILTANLGNFDKPVDPVKQILPKGVEKIKFHRFTDENFAPITGLSPRFQYRIPKLFGWQMHPGYDIYIWLDGSFSMLTPESVGWFLKQLKGADAAFFKHPDRNTIKEESDFIQKKLKEGNRYITPRYKNGLHREQIAECVSDTKFKDTVVFTSTAFIYKNNKKVQDMMKLWWYYQSRYFTCDQIALPYAIFKSKLKVNMINENQYKIPYMTLVSNHR